MLGVFWDYDRTILESVWNCFGSIFELFVNKSGTSLELCWEYFGIMTESFWNHIGIILGVFLIYLGIIWESFRDQGHPGGYRRSWTQKVMPLSASIECKSSLEMLILHCVFEGRCHQIL